MKTIAARWRWVLALWVLLWGLGVSSAIGAGLAERIKGQEISQVLHLKVGQSKVLRTAYPITRISVADPEIADIILISDREVYVNGLAPGVTNLSVWGKTRFTSATIEVEPDLTLLKEKLHRVLPKEKIAAQAAGDSVVLTGEVSGPMAQDTAVTLATSFAGGKKDKVVNMMHVGGVQQVMAEVRVAEIARTILDRMGINWSVLSPQGNIGVQQVGGLGTISNLVRSFTGSSFTQGISTAVEGIAGFKAGGLLWTMFFDVLKEHDLGKVLAEPNLVTTSGREATFLAGGEFPIPVPQTGVGGATITIEFKKFGVGLDFTPYVLDNGRIAMNLNPEVSELDPTTGVTISGFTIPGLKVRRVSTHLEVQDGQTIAMAGLMSDTDRNIISKIPLVGDVPILGNLFRSSSWQKGETELVILVTPHLVKPLAPGAARLPTDKWVDPNDLEKYLLGLPQGRAPVDSVQAQPAQSAPAGFGQQKVE